MGRVTRTCAVILAGVTALLLSACPYRYDSRRYTCLYCRTYKEIKTYAFVPVETQRKTTCAMWYERTYGSHKHEWVQSSCTFFRSILLGEGVACRPSPSIWCLDPEVQRRFLLRATTEEREKFFALIKSPRWEDVYFAVDLARQNADR